jgi:lipopolysaccharide transport system permease protein
VLNYINSLSQTRDLLYAWTGRNIRARYQQSILGWFWAVIQPAAQVVIFSIVFTFFVPIDTGGIPYPVFSFVAVVPWTLLATSLPDMADSLIVNMGLVTKIYFPREILPLAAMLARLMDFGVAAALMIFLMIIFRVPIFLTGWMFLPVILAIQLLLILGLGLACASLNVFFRDVRSILVLGLQIWFYASPILYPVTVVPEEFRSLYFLNPMAGVIEAYRAVLLYSSLPGPYLILSAAISLIIFIGGYWLFKRVEFRIADVV